MGRELQQTDNSMSTQDPLGVTTIGARRGTEIMETQEAQKLWNNAGEGGSETIIKNYYRVNYTVHRETKPKRT
jgi:hypothetical protein